MNASEIVAAIDVEITRLQQAKAILSGTTEKRNPGRPAGVSTSSKATSFNPAELSEKPKKRRVMSEEARARIAAAQRARWAKAKNPAKKAAKKAAHNAAPTQAKKAITKKAIGRKATPSKKAAAGKKILKPKAEQAAAPAV